jgi:hypothetical protein
MIELTERRRLQLKEAHARWRARNAEKMKAWKLRRKLANPERWTMLERAQNKRSYRNNVVTRNADSARYRAKKLERTVAWGTELTDLVCVEAKSLCKARSALFGFSWHMDHIIPLQGRNVSGLHVWNNLQVIPGRDNLAKHNKFSGV